MSLNSEKLQTSKVLLVADDHRYTHITNNNIMIIVLLVCLCWWYIKGWTWCCWGMCWRPRRPPCPRLSTHGSDLSCKRAFCRTPEQIASGYGDLKRESGRGRGVGNGCLVFPGATLFFSEEIFKNYYCNMICQFSDVKKATKVSYISNFTFWAGICNCKKWPVTSTTTVNVSALLDKQWTLHIPFV